MDPPAVGRGGRQQAQGIVEGDGRDRRPDDRVAGRQFHGGPVLLPVGVNGDPGTLAPKRDGSRRGGLWLVVLHATDPAARSRPPQTLPNRTTRGEPRRASRRQCQTIGPQTGRPPRRQRSRSERSMGPPGPSTPNRSPTRGEHVRRIDIAAPAVPQPADTEVPRRLVRQKDASTKDGPASAGLSVDRGPWRSRWR